MKSKQSDKNGFKEEYVTNACPVCYARFHNTTRRRPQQLYDHLMSKSHSNADLTDYLQNEETMNNPTSDMIAHDIKYNLL